MPRRFYNIRPNLAKSQIVGSALEGRVTKVFLEELVCQSNPFLMKLFDLFLEAFWRGVKLFGN